MIVRKLSFLVLATGMALAQANPPGSSTVADELKAMRDAIAAQQQQIAQQQQQISDQRQQISLQQQQIQDLKLAMGEGKSGTPHVENAALRTNAPAETVAVASDAQQPEKPKESPLSFRIGAADFTPGGFVDFENVFRTTNTGNVTATNFGAIPYSNTIAGHLTEYRSTGQYSRFNIRTDAKFGENIVRGYVEFDFNGNDAGNVFVTSNGHTDRLRLYWLDLKRGKWEFLGGQTWGLQTPNRTGVSPMPSDLSLGYHEDAGIGVGYNYTRAGEFRAAYHFNDNFVWAVAVQNPQQFTGGEVLFPSFFNAQVGGQFDSGAVPGTPNLGPDILTKFAWDTSGGHHFHFEAGGVMTTVKITDLPRLGTEFTSHSKVGGGVFGALNYDLAKGPERNLRFVANAMWGNGIGRYLNGLAPNAVVVPITTAGGTTCTSTGAGAGIVVSGNCDVDLSLVHSGDLVAGFEFQLHPKSQFGVYYGGAYAQRNTFRDITGGTAQPFIGFGGPNSGNNNNRAVQEGTIDWTQTFWRNPQYGAVLLVTQASYVTRAPWFVALGAPKNAHLVMGYVSLRYVLP